MMDPKKRIRAAKIQSRISETIFSDRLLDISGVDIVANLMTLDTHDFYKKLHILFEEENIQNEKIRSYKNWNFYNKVNKAKHEDKPYSKKAEGLRNAASLIAAVADIFDALDKEADEVQDE